MAKPSDRFIVVYKQGSMSLTQIWVDRMTGVNYLFHQEGYSGGLTPLLDHFGKPVVSPLPYPEGQ